MPSALVRLLAVVTAASLLPPRIAFADNPDAAALIEQGLDLRQAQRDVEALALFEKAQALAPTPRGQAQVALAQQALGRWLLAERNLRAALAARSDSWIESRRPILDRAMTVIASHLGDVEIVGARSGAVYIDGVRVDDADAPSTGAVSRLRLEVGRRTLELRAAGSYPFSRVLDVLPGEVVRVEVEQHPLLDDKVAGVAPPRAWAAPAPPPSSSGRTQRTLGWVALGGASIFLVTGVVGLIDRDLAAGDFNASTTCTAGTMSSQCEGWRSDGTTGQTLAIVGFVGAGVVGGLSLALLLTSAPSRAKATALSFPCNPVRGGASCSIEATF